MIGPANLNPISYTAAQVAQQLGLSKWTVCKLCRAGTIWPAYLHAGSWHIPRGYVYMADDRKPGGRPPGSKNKKPYPKGVKRPRKTNPPA